MSHADHNECLVFSKVKTLPLSIPHIEKCALYVLRKLKITGSLSIHCIGDGRMKKLNFHYRGKNQTTDVLSFGLEEGESAFAKGNELGDIFISVPQIVRQARDFSVSPKEEFVRMLVHGILHILGYDHEEEGEAQKMFGLQEKLLVQLV